MTYLEAREASLKVKWTTENCGQSTCWCLMVKPMSPIFYGEDNDEEYYIWSAGAVDAHTAKYLVKLHNDSLS